MAIIQRAKMTLTSGAKLGPYEVISPLGAGGMGEVYRARDTRLDRDVAIKVLPSQLSANPDLRQRFEREARAISSLNHPHICSLYDVGSQDGVDFLVMELLEGETLAARLERGPLSLKDLLKTGVEIADALEKAHKQGIIHRDLKPGNIMLTKTGAKLMDFGLAKAAELPRPTIALSGTAVTMTSPASPITQAGTIVGTFQYMSPEQIEGKDADSRSDIFALGCVLYEMATAKRAFEGKSHLSVASAILEKEPAPISQSQPMTPPGLEHVVQSCMAKDPDERYQTAHDVKVELQWISSSGSQAAAPAIHVRSWKRQAWIAGALVAGLILGGIAGRMIFGNSSSSMQVNLTVAPPPGGTFALAGDGGSQPAVSPDGKRFACTAIVDGKQAIYIRSLDDPEIKMVNGTDGASFPFWSTDGKVLGYFVAGQMKRLDLDTGLTSVLATGGTMRGGSWGSKGTIVYSPDFRSEIYSIPASGGTPRKVTALEGKLITSHRWPQFLPDGEHFIYLAINHASTTGEENAVYVGSLDGSANKRILNSSTSAAFSDGKLLFVSDGKLFAQTLDTKSFELKGKAERIADGVQTDSSTWRALFDASPNGTLVAGIGGNKQGYSLSWFDAAGKQVSTKSEPKNFQVISISRDGRTVAAQLDEGLNQLWTGGASLQDLKRITFTPGSSDLQPVFSRDGKDIIYSTDQGKLKKLVLARRPVNGAGEEKVVYDGDSSSVYSTDWSSDGRYVLYFRGAAGELQSLKVLDLQGGPTAYPLLDTPNSTYDGTFSPDMKWIAYTTIEKGRNEVFVVPFAPQVAGQKFASSGGRWQVSTEGGDYPLWSPDGKQIYFVSITNRLMTAKIDPSGGGFHSSTPAELMAIGVRNLGVGYPYAVAPGGRFLVIVEDARIDAPLRVILDWRKTVSKQ